MSYEIIKSVTFYEREKRIVVRSESNNVTPKRYDAWEPTECGYDYREWKRMFAGSLFDGVSKFQPSCQSKAKKAYDRTNELLGISGCEPWVFAQRKFPFEVDYRNYPHGKTSKDELMRLEYERFEEKWTTLFLDVLNLMIGSAEPLQYDWDSLREGSAA
jgi:hypothetical protein